MRIIFFILFTITNFLLIFKVNPRFKPKVIAIAYGISFIVVPILMLSSAYLLNIFKVFMSEKSQKLYIDAFFTLMIIIFLNLFFLLADVMVNGALNFHEKHNAENIDKNPIKLALNNKSGIKSFYRLMFFFGSVLGFYGIWLAKKM